MRRARSPAHARSDSAIIAIAGADIHVFWRRRDDDVEAPAVHLERHAAEAGHAVDEDQRVGRGFVDAAAMSASGFMTPVDVSLCVTSTACSPGWRAARRAIVGRDRGLAPLDVEFRDVGAVGPGDPGEAVAERADGDREDAVARGERVDDGRLEAARPGARQEEDLALACRRTAACAGRRASRSAANSGPRWLIICRDADFADFGRQAGGAGDPEVGVGAGHGKGSPGALGERTWVTPMVAGART